ncbi:MAG: response regulator transcription factor [Solobacterium sp.]|nr:response regulator transcription factor [Solobacterium sp.]
MKLAYLDDEKESLQVFRQTLNEADPDHQHTCEYFSHPDALRKALETSTYDGLFLDIEIGKENGIRLSETLPASYDNRVFYVTSHSELVYSAFNNKSIGFILKNDLKKNLSAALKKLDRYTARVTLQVEGKRSGFPVDSIYYIYYSYRTCILVTKERQVSLSYNSLAELHDLLPKQYFLQISRTHIINIHRIIKLDDNFVYLNCGTRIEKLPYSRRRKDQLRQARIDALR